jgi:Uma2 family endonuclease
MTKRAITEVDGQLVIVSSLQSKYETKNVFEQGQLTEAASFPQVQITDATLCAVTYSMTMEPRPNF